MKKSVKIALYGIPVLLGVYLIYRQLRNAKSSRPYVPPYTPKPEVTPVRTPTQTSSGCSFPLKRGVYNCDLVKQLQWALNHIPVTRYSSRNNLRYRPLDEDGDFGMKTEAVLMDFFGNISNNNIVQDQQELDDILAFVITDPIAFQEAENPYIMAPQPEQPSLPTFPGF